MQEIKTFIQEKENKQAFRFFFYGGNWIFVDALVNGVS